MSSYEGKFGTYHLVEGARPNAHYKLVEFTPKEAEEGYWICSAQGPFTGFHQSQAELESGIVKDFPKNVASFEWKVTKAAAEHVSRQRLGEFMEFMERNYPEDILWSPDDDEKVDEWGGKVSEAIAEAALESDPYRQAVAFQISLSFFGDMRLLEKFRGANFRLDEVAFEIDAISSVAKESEKSFLKKSGLFPRDVEAIKARRGSSNGIELRF